MATALQRLATFTFVLAIGTSDPAPAQVAREIEHQGVKRTFLVANAEAAKDAPKPLLIVLHGRRDAAAPNRSSPMLDALARKEGFVVAYPAGLDGRWNVPAQPTPPSMAGSAPADDAGFISRLMDVLVAEKTAEPRHVYASGFSNGGFLTYGLMCTLGDRLAAAAALGASMTQAQIDACRPGRRVPLLALAGTDDALVPFHGERDGPVHMLAVPAVMSFWSGHHGCTGQKGRALAKLRASEPTSTHIIEWTGCASDGAMVLYRIDGGGHTLPSLTPQSPEDAARNGRRSADFETSEVVWAFLKRWSLP